MNFISGVMCAPGTGSVVEIPITPTEDFRLKLFEGTWRLGIDQSTSCTGMCIQRSDKKYLALLDVKRDKSLEPRMYYVDLYRILQRIASGNKFDQVIMEKPVPKDMYASRVLHELKGRVEEWVEMIPEFNGVLVDSILPQTWKSFVMDKSKGPNRSNVKRCIAEDLVDTVPELEQYFDTYPYTDYDSFDAFGILTGFNKYAFADNGVMLIHGMKEKTHVSTVGYRWIDHSEFKNVLKDLNGFDLLVKPSFLGFNEKYNLYDNIRMATTNWDFVITAIPEKELEPFMWKYNIDIDEPDKVMVGYFVRKGALTKRGIDFFKQEVPWNEEVYGVGT